MGLLIVQLNSEQKTLVQKLHSQRGFVEVFEENLKDSPTFTEAYERTERIHEDLFGERRYSCYQSFCVVKKRN